MSKILTMGINDRDIRLYKMQYDPHSVPPICTYKKRGTQFRIIVDPSHIFFIHTKVFKIFPRIQACFIFNMLNRESLKLIKDENESVEYVFLGRSIDLHKREGQIDPKTATALDYLTQSAFWSGLKRNLQLSKVEIGILMVAGIGIWEMLKNILGMFL